MGPEAGKTADLIAESADRARQVLADEHPANAIILRGASHQPDWPSLEKVYGLRGVAVAAYPMYLGLGKLLGMDVKATKDGMGSQVDALGQVWSDYDFFFLHFKRADVAGENGDSWRKVRLIERVDRRLPRVLALRTDVVIVTGDHSTPATLKCHSLHPVPTLLWSEHCRVDAVHRFGETACLQGALGPRFPAVDLMPLALANAGRLRKLDA
jgi:2,3-bisphosphoglycerate-independent phosphoglycerate mutase